MGEDLNWRHQQWKWIGHPRKFHKKQMLRFGEDSRKTTEKNGKRKTKNTLCEMLCKDLRSNYTTRLPDCTQLSMDTRKKVITSNRSRVARRVMKQWGKYSSVFDTMER